MTAKQYLRQIRDLDKQVSSKLEQIEVLRALAEKVTTTLSPTGGGGKGNKDKTGDLVVKLSDLTKELDDDVDRYVTLKSKTIHMLDSLEDGRYKYILYQYYLNHNTFEQIAVDLNCSYRWVTSLHGQALIEFDKVYRDTLPISSY